MCKFMRGCVHEYHVSILLFFLEPVIPTVPKSSDPNLNRCAVCREDFIEEFKEDNPDNEDDDGGVYHLQNAIRPHKYTFHPQCFSDANKLNNSTISGRLD